MEGKGPADSHIQFFGFCLFVLRESHYVILDGLELRRETYLSAIAITVPSAPLPNIFYKRFLNATNGELTFYEIQNLELVVLLTHWTN